jgi:hypothetical protein
MLTTTRSAMIALAALAVTIGALESIPFPALPLLQRELGLDPVQAGLAPGVQGAAALLTSAPSNGTFQLGFLLAAVVVLLPLALVGGVPGRYRSREAGPIIAG